MTRNALMFGALCVAFVACSASIAADSQRKIVLIGGAKSEGSGRHDYPSAIRVLERLLRSSPELRGLDIESHPDGEANDRDHEGARDGARQGSNEDEWGPHRPALPTRARATPPATPCALQGAALFHHLESDHRQQSAGGSPSSTGTVRT
jgi:hypothetical protein